VDLVTPSCCELTESLPFNDEGSLTMRVTETDDAQLKVDGENVTPPEAELMFI
jgi:hypothetical protein